MKTVRTPRTLLRFALTGCLCLTSCSAFRPVTVSERHFVLSPWPPETTASNAHPTATGLAVGVGAVRLPAYLSPNSLAVRQGPNEIRYLNSILWAERLDKGAQRVLAANLAALLPSAIVRAPAWRPDAVTAEVHVEVGQFDVAASGDGVLEATWRIVAPGGDKVLRTGRSRLTRSGPRPETDPEGGVATLSALLGRLSQELAPALVEAAKR